MTRHFSACPDGAKKLFVTELTARTSKKDYRSQTLRHTSPTSFIPALKANHS